MDSPLSRNRGRWFRFYDSVLDDPKIQLLTDAGKVAWMNLLCMASRNGGLIPDSVDNISFAMRKPVGKVRDLLQVLVSAHLIDRCDGGYTPHNWHEFQYVSDDAAGRSRLYRARQRHKTERDASRDCPVPDTDTESDTEKKKVSRALTRSKRTRIGDYVPSEFEQAKATAYWRSKGRDDLTVADQVERFAAFHTAKGTAMADWPRAWQTWYMNALQFSKGTGHERRPTAHQNMQRGTITALKRITGE